MAAFMLDPSHFTLKILSLPQFLVTLLDAFLILFNLRFQSTWLPVLVAVLVLCVSQIEVGFCLK